MNNVVTVQVVNAKANVNKNFPDKVFNKHLTILFFYIAIEIAMLTVLHHNVNLCVNNKCVAVAHYEVTIELSK